MCRILQCPVCGKTFETYANRQKYCSARCRWKSVYSKHRGEILQCPTCGKSFETRSWQQKYCSDNCRQQDYWKKNRADVLFRQKIYRITGKYPHKKK